MLGSIVKAANPEGLRKRCRSWMGKIAGGEQMEDVSALFHIDKVVLKAENRKIGFHRDKSGKGICGDDAGVA